MSLTREQLARLGVVLPDEPSLIDYGGVPMDDSPNYDIMDFAGQPGGMPDEGPAYPEYVQPQLLEPTPYDFRERLALALQSVPQYQGPLPYEGGGSAFARGLMGGLAGGFSRGTLARRSQKDVAREKENELRTRQAERDYRRATASATRRQALVDAKELKASPGPAAQPGAQKSLAQIEAEAEARARGSRKGNPPSENGGGLFGSSPMQSQTDDIVEAIITGFQPPDLKGLYRFGGPVRAGLARRGYDYTKANLDWQAMQRWVANANSTKQIQLKQSANTAYESLDVVDELNSSLSRLVPRGSVRAFNRATLTAAMNGAFGKEAQNAATQLRAQITDIVSELGNVYMGGNSPTDEALKLAAKNLSADWSLNQLRSATDLARRNLRIRLNSIRTVRPMSTGGEVGQEMSGAGGAATAPTGTMRPAPPPGLSPPGPDGVVRRVGGR